MKKRLDPSKLPNGALAIAVLADLRQALRRLGDDPAYYSVSAEMLGDLAGLNPSLVDTLNKWVADMNAKHVVDLT